MPGLLDSRRDGDGDGLIGDGTPREAPLHARAPALRAFDDPAAIRRGIYDNVLRAAAGWRPIANQRHQLGLEGVAYEDPPERTLAEQKAAILRGDTLGRRLRGDWVLRDVATGAEVARKRSTLATVPYITPRGTFIQGGSEYTLAHQLRLRPGIYARRKDNGELEAHVNVAGLGHRIGLEPDTGVFRLGLGQAKLPLVPLLKAMGVTDARLRERWGNEVAAANLRHDDPGAVAKLHAKAARGQPLPGETAAAHVARTFAGLALDPDVMRRTLGTPYDHVSPDALMDAAAKLVAINKGAAEPDDRDHLAYMTLHGPEDLIAERIGKDRLGLRKALWRSSMAGSVAPIPANIFTKSIHAAITGSGLGQAVESINPLQIFEQQGRVSRMGEGGIPSLDSVPAESRNVQPSHLGFVDPLVTPESLRAGVDSRIARGARKGDDGRVYAPFRDARTGRVAYRSPQDLADATVAFPTELASGRAHVAAMVAGRARFVPRGRVEHELPHMEDAFSPLTNLVPLKSAVKGQRAVMAGRMLSQALPVDGAEAPFVQNGMPDRPGDSYENSYGAQMGAVRSQGHGTVRLVQPGRIVVRDAATGRDQVHDLYENFPYNRKTFIHQSPTVRPGDVVAPGGLLARSNYTDDQGVAALGRNARVAYVPFRGLNFEDAVVISRSFADKIRSQHMYQHALDLEDGVQHGRRAHTALFAGKYDRNTLAKFDDDGVIRPGSEVDEDHPLILAVKKRDVGHNSLHRGRAASYDDHTVTWDHHGPGVVTDVAKTPRGVVVSVRTTAHTEVGDKLCYSTDTEILTAGGWKPVAAVTADDPCASLTADGVIEYINPIATHVYDHDGRMYNLETTQASLLVTDNHKLYAQVRRGKQRYADPYQLVEAQQVYGRRYRLKRDGVWRGQDPDQVRFAALAVPAGRGGRGQRTLPVYEMPVRTYAMLLGMFLAEGNCFSQPGGNRGIDITQTKQPNRAAMLKALADAGIKYSEHGGGTKVRIYGTQLFDHFRQFGNSWEKFIPHVAFEWDRATLAVLYEWLMWGDGSRTGTGHVYHTTSKRLADDVQRLVLHLGMSANIDLRPATRGTIKGKEYDFRPRYWVSIFRTKNNPEINHSHVKKQGGQLEQWVDYAGQVHCVTLPRNHVLYVRRNGKPVWCGNSGRYGDKGIISAIVPDEEMPHDKDGTPYEVLPNPLGVISRTNPGQMHEAALGKIVEKTGRAPYRVVDFQGQDQNQFAMDELRKHGLSDTEDIYDPVRGTKIPGVFTGNRFFMKLHHTAESKGGGRGLAGYTMDGKPAKGGPEGAKRLALMDVNAILSHGATAVLRDAGAVRGQQHPELWRQFMSGHPMPQPKVAHVHQKFVDTLRAAGINVVRHGTRLNIMALTDRDVDALAGRRNLESAETVGWKQGLRPVAGGLFDPALTGGHGGTSWAAMPLVEPLPNPVMQEPIMRMLGLTKDRFRSILAGRAELGGRTGPGAIGHALAQLKVPDEIHRARLDARSGRRGARDLAVKRLGYLQGVERTGVHPRDWMLSRVPVLPPKFRPVAVMSGSKLPLVADANYLYRELHDASRNLAEMRDRVGDVGDERLAVYDAFRAVAGLGDPLQPKNQERQVKGLLKHVFGTGGPKTGMVQRQLIGTATDLVGRAVIAPNPDLDMDQAGIPEARAWDVYRPFVVRRLVRRGMPNAAAARHVADRSAVARRALLDEMDSRPVILNRAPVLHRYGVMAFRPVLAKGDTLQVSPLCVTGFGADFDGDAMQYHVPADDEAAQDALDKMLPSRNLLSVASYRPHQLPSKEYAGGLYSATSAPARKVPARVYRTMADVERAYRSGEVSLDHPVHVLEDS